MNGNTLHSKSQFSEMIAYRTLIRTKENVRQYLIDESLKLKKRVELLAKHE